VNRQPRDHDALDRGDPPSPAGPPPDASPGSHPVSRPVLRGHFARRHLQSATDLVSRLHA
jgi:hypothetical protein